MVRTPLTTVPAPVIDSADLDSIRLTLERQAADLRDALARIEALKSERDAALAIAASPTDRPHLPRRCPQFPYSDKVRPPTIAKGAGVRVAKADPWTTRLPEIGASEKADEIGGMYATVFALDPNASIRETGVGFWYAEGTFNGTRVALAASTERAALIRLLLRVVEPEGKAEATVKEPRPRATATERRPAKMSRGAALAALAAMFDD